MRQRPELGVVTVHECLQRPFSVLRPLRGRLGRFLLLTVASLLRQQFVGVALRAKTRAVAFAGAKIIQRFGAALNLNIHVHALVLDGVYVEDGAVLRFHACDPPTDDEMDRLLGTIERRLDRLLTRVNAECPQAAGCATTGAGCVGGRRDRITDFPKTADLPNTAFIVPIVQNHDHYLYGQPKA